MTATARIQWLPRRALHRQHTPQLLPSFDPSDFSPALRTRLLILQPTPFCNIDCDYCYLPERNSTARMSMATVRIAAERLRNDGLSGEDLTVVWHAGEPLAMPVEFYEEAVSVIREVFGRACRVSHSIQTNGTLIDDKWCELFKRHDFKVGVSVDGPAALHDAHRRTRSGRGTHDRVMRGMQTLRAHGIPFHAIAVVTSSTFDQADAFYDFFMEQGVSELGCNYDEAEGLHQRSSLAGHESAHCAFVARLLERATAEKGQLRIREFAMALNMLKHRVPTYHWQGRDWPDNAQTLPFALITVAHNGDFSSFSPELLGQPSVDFNNFILGNVHKDGYLDGARSERFRRLWNQIVLGMEKCERSCAYYGFCGGGAPANKLYENGDLASAETLYCRTMVKRPFDMLLEHTEKMTRRTD